MGKISLILIIIVASATFYFTSTSFKKASNQAPHRTYFDKNHRLHVMGIILGQSTVRDAELAFRSRSETAIFMYPKGESTHDKKQRYTTTLEAYFPSIADHTKVLLKLMIDDVAFQAMQKRSTSPRIYPNAVARRNLTGDDVIAVLKLKIRELTLIPSVQLNADILSAQFGQAASHHQIDKDTTVYTFPKLGLTATIHEQSSDTLVFSNNPQGKAH